MILPPVRRFAFPILSLLLAGLPARSQTRESDLFQARTTRLPGTTMHYRLFIPKDYSPAKKYPVVVALHGVGERGTDNRVQVDREDLAHPWIEDTVQAKVPHFVMVPQCPPDSTWGGMRGVANSLGGAGQGIVDILDSMKREFAVDTNRFYLAGLSMGAGGGYNLLKNRPGLFAAAALCAAGGDTSAAGVIARTPLWTFHGSLDGNPPGSRNMAAAFERRGIPVVRFVSQVALPSPTLTSYRNAIRGGTPRTDLVAKSPAGISYDSLARAVSAGADHLYSELTGGDHRSGWMIAWHHPLLAGWMFSKSKGDGPVAIVRMPAQGRRARDGAVPTSGRFEQASSGKVFSVQGRRLQATPELPAR